MEYKKVILVGDPTVGKTSLINRFVTKVFTGEYISTLGVAISSKRVIIKHDQEVYLQIWDIAGQTLFQKFRNRFFNEAHGALLVFDLTVPKSLKNLHSSWIKDILDIVGKIPLILLGNKDDLKQFRLIWPQEIKFFSDQYPEIVNYYDTSALTGHNVENAFLDVASRIFHFSYQNKK